MAALEKARLANLDLYISEFSFIELMLGYDDENQLEKHYSNMKSVGLHFLGKDDDMKTYCDPDIIKGIIDFQLQSKFKIVLKEKKKSMIYPYFRYAFSEFSHLMMIVLNKVDKNYWYDGFRLLNSFETDKKGLFDIFVRQAYDDFFDKKKAGKRLLFDLFKNLLAYLLSSFDRERYQYYIVIKKLDDIDLKKMGKIVFDSLKLKSISFYGNENFVIPFMKYLANMQTNMPMFTEEDVLIKDAINYIVLNTIFVNKKFDSHDFIDFMNMAMIVYPYSKIYYYSNDKKWIEFYEYEKFLRSDHFKNFYMNLDVE